MTRILVIGDKSKITPVLIGKLKKQEGEDVEIITSEEYSERKLRNITGEYVNLYEYKMNPIIPEMEDMKYYGLTKAEREAKISPIRTEPKIQRNELCSCGSGKKYKKCCGK